MGVSRGTEHGMLADLDSNGVNQFLIENEASIERVDLETIKTEFIDQKYQPSYTVDENEAQMFPWYLNAKKMQNHLNNILSHLSDISKQQRRLEQVSARVMQLDHIRSTFSGAITGSVNEPEMAKTKSKLDDLQNANEQFLKFADTGFPLKIRNAVGGVLAQMSSPPTVVESMKNAHNQTLTSTHEKEKY